MSSGGSPHLDQHGADARDLHADGVAERGDGGRAGAMLAAGAAAAGETLRSARSRAEAAVESAAAVGHGGLAAGTAAASLSAAAGGGEEVAGRIAVLEPAAPFRRESGTSRGRI